MGAPTLRGHGPFGMNPFVIERIIIMFMLAITLFTFWGQTQNKFIYFLM